MTDKATLTQYLTEARAARHRLMTGSQVERVRTETEEVGYTRATIGQLTAYIQELERRLGLRKRGTAIGVGFR